MMRDSDDDPVRVQTMAERPWVYAAAGLSVAAGIIHLAVMPEHFAEWPGYGLFFLVAAAAQLGYAGLLLTRTADRNLLLAGIAGNGLIIAFYLVTRTLGIPFFGPHAGEVEAIGVLDAASKIIELALIGCLAAILRRRPASAQTTGPLSG
jgi:hypothetical protein